MALVLLRIGKLASASDDHTVRVWDVGTGVCEAVLAGHTDAVYALTELRDSCLASCSHDCSVRVWDVSTRACTAVLVHASFVFTLAALPQGGVAAGCYDCSIALWSAAGVRMATLGGGAGFGEVRSLALLSDGRLVTGYGYPGPYVIRVWDVKRRACDVIISGHTDTVRSLAALPDGRLLSGSNDRTLKVWDERVLSVRGGAAADTCFATLVGHTHHVMALAVLPDRRVVSGGFDGTVRVWQ
jgi:WD40 repeat protein